MTQENKNIIVNDLNFTSYQIRFSELNLGCKTSFLPKQMRERRDIFFTSFLHSFVNRPGFRISLVWNTGEYEVGKDKTELHLTEMENGWNRILL